MPLAAILGMCLLWFWPIANFVSSVPAIAISQSTQDPQKAPDQLATPPQPPAPVTQPCPQNSQSGSTVKSDCQPAKSSGAKSKTRHHKAVAPAGVPAGTGPPKTVVPNGGTADPTLDLSTG